MKILRYWVFSLPPLFYIFLSGFGYATECVDVFSEKQLADVLSLQLIRPIKSLDLDSRTQKQLATANIHFVSDLIQLSPEEVSTLIGDTLSRQTIRDELQQMGLDLGMARYDIAFGKPKKVWDPRLKETIVQTYRWPKIDALYLPKHIEDNLKKAHIENIYDLISLHEKDLKKQTQMDTSAITIINKALNLKGLTLSPHSGGAENRADDPFNIDKTWLIGSLNLSVQTKSVLSQKGVRTIEQLINLSEQELSSIPFIGRKAMLKVKAVLAEYDLSLRAPADNYIDIPIMDWPLEALRLQFSARTYNALTYRIKTVSQLVAFSEQELSSMPLMGRKAMSEVKAVLEEHDLNLRTDTYHPRL